jgi:hypothetical protein
VRKSRIQKALIFSLTFSFFTFVFAYATPSTHIWAPSADIQPYKKIHITADSYTPAHKRDVNGNRVYVQQVYGLTFSLLSDKPEDNFLGKFWSPLGKIMAEAGLDYKKGLGDIYDTFPWYFNFKMAVLEDAYFKNMPALAIGVYDVGTKHNITDNKLWYFKAAKTCSTRKLNLGRLSAGFFNGNGRLLRDKNNLRDNIGPMFAWERTISEISDKLWLCVDYQGTQSSYGAMNYGFAWRFSSNVSAIAGYEIYNNPSLRDTVTFQLDIDF